MSVSHYVVSWIQVIGLLIGLMGLFYLSLPVFHNSDSALKYLRPVLPAIALAILMAVGPLVFTIPGQGHDPSTVIITIVVGFLAGYFISYTSQGKRASGVSFAVMTPFAVLVNFLAAALASGSLAAALPTLPFDMLMALFFVGAILLPVHLTKERVQYIGVAVSVLAVLTQFIPPILDLLNIPIR